MDPRVTELHCLMPIANARSVLEHGILSYARAVRLRQRSVAIGPIRDRRDVKSIPQGLKLHQYANLYFYARNPLMFKLRAEASTLCVLRVSTEVLRLPGTVITDGDAASDYVRCLAPSLWSVLNFDDIMASDWHHPEDPLRCFQHKSRKYAEVLVPERVEARFLTGAYVVDSASADHLRGLGFDLPVGANPALFLRE